MRKLFVLLIFSALASCQSEQAPLPKDTMASILQDMHIAETYAQIDAVDKGGYSRKNYDSLFVHYSHIYKKYDLDTATFHQALDWYKRNPKEFDLVYEQVLNDLSVLKEAYQDSISEYSDSVSVRPDTAQNVPAKPTEDIKNSLKD